MPSTLALDLDSLDLDLAGGVRGQLVSGARAVAQACVVTLSTRLGEWWLDAGIGLQLFGRPKGDDLRILRGQIVDQLGRLAGVRRIERLTLELDNRTRHLRVSLVVRVDDVTVTIQSPSAPSAGIDAFSPAMFAVTFTGPDGIDVGLAPLLA